MGQSALKDLKAKTEELSTEENLDLIVYLLNKVRTVGIGAPARRSWQEIRGKAPYPMAGEDAQVWVTRGRKEADEKRTRQ